MNKQAAAAAAHDGSHCGDEWLIEARDMRVVAGDRVLVTNIDICVASGEVVTVIGPNGAGKTTLAKALLGLVPLDRGSIRRREGLSVGYVPQRFSVDAIMPLSVARLMTLTARRPRSRVREALDETGVADLIDQPFGTLSGGETQRVLLARALLRDPQLLILDEPVQGVDFAGEAELYRLIESIRNHRACGVLMISHDLHVVMATTDRVVCINQHVCCAGTPDSVSQHPEYVRLFGRQADGALALYAHIHDHHHEASGRIVEDVTDQVRGAVGKHSH